MKKLDAVAEFGVVEMSTKMMENTVGGLDIVYNIGYATGYVLYYAGKAGYNAVKKLAALASEALN